MEQSFPDYDERLVAQPVTGANGKKIGSGLFTKGRFAPGEIAIPLDWSDDERTEILSWDDTEEEHHNRCVAIAPRWYFYVSDEHPLWFLNHSCEPNVAFRDFANLEGEEMIPLVALREILPGEELTLDYSYTIAGDDGLTDEESYSMDCLCGKPTCRKVLTNFANLPIELQRKELFRRLPFSGTIPAFILNELPELVEELKQKAPDLFETFETALEAQLELAEEFEEDYDPDEPYYLTGDRE